MPSLAVLLSACVEPVPLPVPAPSDPAVIFLVRHGEKESSASDALLTEAGHARAALLAETLSDVELIAVHSTDTARTRATAQPTAEAHGLVVQLYPTSDALVETITAARGSHLVVGHSDTLPGLVSLLDPGAAVEPISSSEFDRLYLVVQTDAGTSTTLLRYGVPPE